MTNRDSDNTSFNAKNANEEFFKKIFEMHNAIMLLIEPKSGKIIKVNKAAEEFYGYNAEQFSSLKIQDINQLTPEQVKKERLNALHEKRNHFIFPHKLSNGEVKTVEVHSFPIDYDGKHALFSIIHDITERKKAENKLKATEEMLNSFMDSVSDSFYLLDEHLNFIEINQTSLNFLQKKKEEIIGKNIADIVPDIKSSGRYDKHMEVIRTGVPFIVEDFIPHPTFGDRHFILKSFKVGNGLGVIVFDITKSKKAELELITAKEKAEENEIRFRAVFEQSKDAIAVSKQGTNMMFNQAYLDMFGYETREELIGKSLLEQIAEKERERIISYVQKRVKGENVPNQYETIGLRKDGTEFPFEVNVGEIIFENEKYTLAIIRDITERKKAENEIIMAKERAEDSERKLKASQTIAKLGSWELDVETGIFTFTDNFYNIFRTNAEEMGGYQMSINDYSTRFVHPDDAHMVGEETKKAIETNDPDFTKYVEHRIIYNDGRVGYIGVTFFIKKDKNGKTVKTHGVNQDITERKKNQLELAKHKNELERLVKERTTELELTNKELELALQNLKETQSQLVQSEKMASLGILTAGVAHELNNPLNYIQSGIYGFMNLINHGVIKTSEPEKQEKILKAMNIGIKRATNILKSLNTFSRKGDDTFKNLNIHEVIDSCLVMLYHEFKDKCIVKKDYTREKFRSIGIQESFHQVFINILMNSIQAIEEEGIISIITKVSEDKKKFLITITDNGKGIDKENMKKIFDPFFTTKAPGKGTGLGLSIVYKIIKNHNGKIHYNSELGKGTEVTIELPIS